MGNITSSSNSGQEQLECRIVVTTRPDRRTEVGMYCPRTMRYEPLGVHGPSQVEVDCVVHDLKASIERAGHRLTFCERSR